MPRLPVGQTETRKWPVLDLGCQPKLPLAKWRLIVDGEVERPRR
jgi:DMSO/TMAO reductase YedYZ molybdopterin-dependent catalytic subunit